MSRAKAAEQRKEGWGSVENAKNAHYFRNDRSLCGRWLAWGGPRWEAVQELGAAATKGTCKACWTKRAVEEARK